MTQVETKAAKEKYDIWELNFQYTPTADNELLRQADRDPHSPSELQKAVIMIPVLLCAKQEGIPKLQCELHEVLGTELYQLLEQTHWTSVLTRVVESPRFCQGYARVEDVAALWNALRIAELRLEQGTDLTNLL